MTLGTQYKEQMARIPVSLGVLPTISTVNGHRHVVMCFKSIGSTFHSLQLLSLAPCSSHPDSLMQMAAHTLPPLPISVSDVQGEVRTPIANIRNSVNILIITLSLIKRHTTETRV